MVEIIICLLCDRVRFTLVAVDEIDDCGKPAIIEHALQIALKIRVVYRKTLSGFLHQFFDLALFCFVQFLTAAYLVGKNGTFTLYEILQL